MDDIVKQAMAKWPDVPACYGWLGLDGRGRWFLRDAPTQAAGDFRHARGSLLEHEKLIDFIGRNYLAEPDGRWYFQNGPQRVYVELLYAPWVWRLQPSPQGLQVTSHTGLVLPVAEVQKPLLDEAGHLYLANSQGLGLVHSLDTELAAQAMEAGQLESPEEVKAASLAQRYGFVMSPLATQAQ